MVYTVLISAHAAAGLISFTAGCLALTRRSYFTVYFWSLVLLVVFLTAALALDWSRLNTILHAVFTGLLALGGYMVWRATQARRLQETTSHQQLAHRIDHIGFTLIALFDGFVIIAALDLGAPAWLAVVVAIAGVAVGHIAIRTLKIRQDRDSDGLARSGRYQAQPSADGDAKSPST
jgi:hypothetical protein